MFQFLCNSYGLLGGEFRDALKSAWATAPEENRTPAQVFRELTELVEKELSLAGAHNIMSEEHFACSRRATLERLARAKDAQALAASHLEDLEAMASGVEAGGPVRFFGLVGGFGFFDGLKTETRVGWSQKALDDFADQYASEEYQNDYNRVRHGINRKGGQPLYRANRKGGQSQSIVGEASLPEGKSKFEQLVLKQLRSDMAMTVKDIKTAEKWLNKGR
ncbi:unnamed protein product [Amoebophrya sp. A120]|nr:unnamed protein product [Amoebophrya sp. A120]